MYKYRGKHTCRPHVRQAFGKMRAVGVVRWGAGNCLQAPARAAAYSLFRSLSRLLYSQILKNCRARKLLALLAKTAVGAIAIFGKFGK